MFGKKQIKSSPDHTCGCREKNRRDFFQSLEKKAQKLPMIGNFSARFSNHWKMVILEGGALRRSFLQCLSWLRSVAGAPPSKCTKSAAVVCLAFFAVNAQAGFFLQTDFHNPVNHVSDPEAVTAFSGHAVPHQVAPSNTMFKLTQSAFAQPLIGIQPDYLFGEEIVLPPDVVTNGNPIASIDPPAGAVWLDYANLVIATESGTITIEWNLQGGGTRVEVYNIGSAPSQPPVTLYWTHGSFKGPAVNVGLTAETILHYNNSVTSNDVDILGGILQTIPGTSAEGKIVLEYKDGGATVLLGIEIVDVKQPSAVVRSAEIGRRLLPAPSNRGTNGLLSQISRGENEFVTRVVGGSRSDWLFPIKRTETPLDCEVFWQHESILDVIWPYAVERYVTDWPADAQVYVRGEVGVDDGPSVEIPNAYQVTLMPYQEPPGHASLSVKTFSSSGNGFALLKYTKETETWFEPVRSVVHTNESSFSLVESNWVIGVEIMPANTNEWLAAPGYVYEVEGDYYNLFQYQWPNDPSHIFPVNEGVLEVWWYQESSLDDLPEPIVWPGDVTRYASTWPTNAPTIVLASGAGATNFPPEFGSPLLYYQNDPALPGYNPNDEHALIIGGVPYAIQSGFLNTPSSGEPFVLVDYVDQLSGEPKMALWEVFDTDATYPDHLTQVDVGDFLAPTFPLPLLGAEMSSHSIYFLDDPAHQDRNGDFWAREEALIKIWFDYPVQPSFAFPEITDPPTVGETFAYRPIKVPAPPGVVVVDDVLPVKFNATWPTLLPILAAGETLVQPKMGCRRLPVKLRSISSMMRMTVLH